MAKRHFRLSDEAVEELKRAEQTTKKAAELRRMQAVRLYGSGQTIAQVTTVTRLSARSILRWVAHYQDKGTTGLLEYVQTGNRTLLTDAQRRELADKLHQYRPVDLHLSGHEYWTVSDLVVAVEQWYGVVYKHPKSYQQLLHASGFTFQRSTKVYRHKPGAAALAEFEAQLEKK